MKNKKTYFVGNYVKFKNSIGCYTDTKEICKKCVGRITHVDNNLIYIDILNCEPEFEKHWKGSNSSKTGYCFRIKDFIETVVPVTNKLKILYYKIRYK